MERKWQDKGRNGEENLILQIDLSNIYQPITAKYLLLGAEYKDAARINAIGQELEAEFGVKHLPSDFKKHNGYLRSLQLSEQYGLYRQDYCGCEFSAKARGIEG